MGESGPRRSTLVSRLPIFRRSSSKRQESLPSSPSSGGVANGVTTSSPSSTNSSSSSTGKRRSLFRTPSLSFSSKRHRDPPPPAAQPKPHAAAAARPGRQRQRACDDRPSSHPGGGRTKTRHSFGFGGHRSKKISRSQTEDFDKASSSSSSTANRNVFINCISSGTNEGDDSGYLEDYSGGSKRSSKQKKQLLPKSFSAHHRFSRHPEHRKAPDVDLEPPTSTTILPGEGGLVPASLPGELLGVGGESSLQSPMISEDRTTAITPSEFVPVTEDSVSEVDALLAPSPSPGLTTGQDTVSASPPVLEHFSLAVSTSQVFFTPAQSGTERPLLPDTSTANTTDYETAASLSEPETTMPSPPPPQQSEEAREAESAEERQKAREEVSEVKSEVEERKGPGERPRGYQTETTSESEADPGQGEGGRSNPEQSDRRATNILSLQEAGRPGCCGRQEPRPSHLRKPHTNSMCSSVSPYHGVMRLERRLRSSSEGAGGPPMQPRHRDPPGTEGYSLLKHRTNSSSSKLGSLDVMSNLGSSELDEDDLMLDLDLSDDQRQRHVSREDSSQSLTLLPSPIEISGDRIPGKESKNSNHRELSRPTTLLSADWLLGLGKDEEPLPPGLEALPLGRMQQDCTSVKTLLLRLRRTLQESTETSPASSLHSLPISPCSEKSVLLKDPGREDLLLQQLREKDELILRLQTEMECAKAAMKLTCQKNDRTTQTEPQGAEPIPPGRSAGLSSSSSFLRERRPLRSLGADHANLYGHCSRTASERHCLGVLAPSTARPPGPILAHDQTPAPGSSPAYIPPIPSPNPSRVSAPVPGSAPAPDSVPAAPASTSRPPEKDAFSLRCGSLSGGVRRLEHPPSQIPRAVGAGSSAAPSRSSPWRLGQPPRGPLSLHMYSRKNVFLHHSLHTAELQALAQHDS
ncbi:LOW QUALITY PROTEIN: serine-rich coiled-coil domain-containing protein 1-like [Aplochiton taeniatus]